jgi:hypothetical protein
MFLCATARRTLRLSWGHDRYIPVCPLICRIFKDLVRYSWTASQKFGSRDWRPIHPFTASATYRSCPLPSSRASNVTETCARTLQLSSNFTTFRLLSECTLKVSITKLVAGSIYYSWSACHLQSIHCWMSMDLKHCNVACNCSYRCGVMITTSSTHYYFAPIYVMPMPSKHESFYSSSLISMLVFDHWRAGICRLNMMSISR